MLTMNKILIVDDVEENIDIMVGLLKNFDLLVALDGKSAIEIANEEPVDLILLDIVMPNMDGFEVCKHLKASRQTADIPIIFLTAKTDEDSIEKAYEYGGIDYVTKPFKPKELLARVNNQLKLKQLIEHLHILSSFDAMTNVYNRRKFFEEAERLHEHNKNELVGIMLDIDEFKAINDEYGHSTGDKVIKAVAKSIHNTLPSNGVMGRLGGEEFAIVIECNWQDACDLTELIRCNIQNLQVFTDDQQSINFTISGGLALNKTSHKNVDQLLRTADDALYEAKRSGRNKSIFIH